MTTYEPGTHVLITSGTLAGRTGLVTANAGERRSVPVALPDGEEEGGIGVLAYGPSSLRPLVVIDPQDREAVERLVDTFRSTSGWCASVKRESANAMQHALREFATPTPPKLEEPTGLGAVVEDAEGNRWVRASQYVTSHRNDWHREAGTSTGADRRHYDGIAAVRVLSSGVEA